MKKKINLLPLLFVFTNIFAQNNLPPVYKITSDTALYAALDSSYSGYYASLDNNTDKRWQKLEDHTGKLTITQVSSVPVSGGFHFNNTSKFDWSAYAYWYRYRLKNEMNHDVAITIPTFAGYCDLYTTDGNGKWKHYENGWLVPWSKRDGLKILTQIELVLKPGQEVLVYERERITSLIFVKPGYTGPMGIGFTDKIVRQNYVDNEGASILVPLANITIGISLLAALFNLFFYRIVREKIYLYFSLFLVSLAINKFLNGSGPLNASASAPFFREVPLVLNALFLVSNNLLVFGLIYFILHYFEIFVHYPKLYKLLKVIGRFFLIFLIVPFLLPFIPDGWYKMLLLTQVALRDITLMLIAVALLFFFRVKGFSKLKIVYIWPFYFLWGCMGTILDTYYVLLDQFFGISVPGWVAWIATWWTIIEIACISWMVLFFSWSLFKRFSGLQKKIAQQALDREIERSLLIELQKVELEKTVDERTAELKLSLHNLKATQAQLVQSEKMASLGELTAGIAHEIQNPLNFVNNFSEVNREMIGDLKMELKSGNMEEALVIAGDLEQNEEKINHHGRRADAIVKGMLQHSRGSSGQKEPTNINALADEYLRLSYHGLRAKDKSFNAVIETDFDNSIGKININAQDIGRVILNLLNNAFYAVNEKSKQRPDGYEPAVSVRTRKLADQIVVSVRDNGNGIPQKILDKIYQPFFTTKPTGQGTGLGLSMSYDIIKAHSGELKVDTVEGEFTEFSVYLPLN